jgi:hypothetical protein
LLRSPRPSSPPCSGDACIRACGSGPPGTARTLIVSFGGYAFLAQLASSLIERSGVLVLGVLGPVSAVTVFAIAVSLIDYVRALAAGIRTTLAPRASAL